MNANCIICADLFQPTSEIYTTTCGHLFHFVCLIQWIERSKTCPQCRHKETERTIHKVFINVPSTDEIPDNIITLQAKVDNSNFQLSLKEKDITNYLEKYQKCKANRHTLRVMAMMLFDKAQTNRFAMKQMKEQIQYYKEKVKDKEKCEQEVIRLHMQIENMNHLRDVIDGSEEQVKDIIKCNKVQSPKSMCIFVATLQKELTEHDRKAQKLNAELRVNKSDFNELKAKAFVLKKRYEELKKDLEAHETCPAKIASLKETLSSALVDNQQIELNKSVNRAIFESPAPLRPDFNAAFVDVDAKESPTVAERVSQIKASDSPYLPIKSSVGNGYGFLLQAKYKIPTKGASARDSSSSADKYSIFNKKLPPGPYKGEYIYNGLGGHSKDEKFPQPKNAPAKRSINQASSKSKFRKLNPDAKMLFNLNKK